MKSSAGSAIKLLRIAVSVLLLTAFYLSSQAFTFTEKQSPLLPLKLDAKQTSSQHNYTQEELNSFLETVAPSLGIDGKKGGIGGETPDAVTSRSFTGKMANDNFGNSVASAGDVNGDGYADIIIGAYNSDPGGLLSSGTAYIYYGGPIINTVADVILTGTQEYGYFACSVDGAGDVNADGYDDVIVGAYLQVGTTNSGRAFIYYGGSPMNNVADGILTGEASSDYFGYSVAGAGDVNSDGYDDVVVGAYFNDYTASNAGRAYIYYGGASWNSSCDVFLNGVTSADNFGYSVAGAGDVNGDGYDDVIVGAYKNDYNGADAGRAYIYYGGSTMNNGIDVTLNGQVAGDLFGCAVSTAGDVNGDGYKDVIVGAYKFDNVGSDCGRGYIYYGGSSMNNTCDVYLDNKNSNDWFGYSVSTAGDVNSDGFSDVIVGAYQNDAGGANAGKAYVYFGGTAMDNNVDAQMIGDSLDDNLGWAVAGAGDFNGDGYDDIIAGAPNSDIAASNAGRVLLYLNTMTGNDLPDEFFTGSATGDYLGFSLATAGDVNGDGYPDLIIGAPDNDAGGTDAGRAYIYYGGAIIDNIADVTLTGAAANDEFGVDVSTAGDVNGDGYSDVIVGASLNDAGGTNAGRAYIYYGGSSMNNVADVILTGEIANNNFGHSVSTTGDVNGDGYADVIISAPSYNSSTGRAYIYFGGSSMNNTADVILTGQYSGDLFGKCVSGAGDVNGDGYADVVVSAPENDNAGIQTGSLYLYFGGLSMNNTADIVMSGDVENCALGYSISSAGDVNGDGYSDVIASAWVKGKAFIYFGGSSMNNTVDLTLTGGEMPSDYFGYSVSSAGDVNGDGYSDVVVGTYSGEKAYIFFGSSSMDNMVDIKMTGVNEGFGLTVASAGDMNNDGYDDVMVGAPYKSSATGRAYLYLSSPLSVSPKVTSVRDIPYDQGGYVKLNWRRSGYDAKDVSKITTYTIQRSDPPAMRGYVWEDIGTVIARKETEYTFTAATPYDSSSSTGGTFHFRIIANTTNAGEFWVSNVMSGHSADNLAPALVRNFYLEYFGAVNKLGWKKNTEPDIRQYNIYRSLSPTIDPLTEPVYMTNNDTINFDYSPLNGKYYYHIAAKDIHDNLGPVSTVLSPNIQVNLTIFIEGFFDGAMNISDDTIVTYLTDSWTPFDKKDTCIAVLKANGTATLNFFNAQMGSYYLVINHRNGLETWSKEGGEVLTKGSVSSYNFTTGATQAYGSNMVYKGTKWCIYSGDVNHDGQISLDDLLAIDVDNQNFETGYKATDVNGDGQITLDDLLITDVNNQNFISVQKPGGMLKKVNK